MPEGTRDIRARSKRWVISHLSRGRLEHNPDFEGRRLPPETVKAPLDALLL
ncbi:MAG: hypothetical protein P8129_24675 [Anaerolineae bacterium]